MIPKLQIKPALLAATALIGLGAVRPASADLIGSLHSTGAGASYGSIDAHWTVNGGPAYVGTQAASFWLPGNATSDWIGPVNAPPFSGSDNPATVPAGSYSFATSFSLTGALLTLGGQFAADNGVTDILINGKSTGISLGVVGSPSYGSFNGFAPLNLGGFAGLFTLGSNTLTFLANNDLAGGYNPTGLRVELLGTQASAAAVAEPMSMSLLGTGLLGLGLLRRRRTTVG